MAGLRSNPTRNVWEKSKQSLMPVGGRAPRNHENNPSPQLPTPLFPLPGGEGRGEGVKG